MKTQMIYFLVLLQLMVSNKLFQQQSNTRQAQLHNSITKPDQQPQGLTPNGVLDNIYDLYGNKYKLSDLLIEKRTTIQSDNPTQKGSGPIQIQSTSPTASCSAGYFNLYFENGSGMEGTSATELARRAVVCQIFSDLSAFITSPLSTTGKRVNIFVRNMVNMGIANPSSNGTAGLASSFFCVPTIQNIGGVVDNTIWQTIISGQDAYTNVAPPMYTSSSNGGNFYHGQISFNFANPAFSWHLNLSSSTAAGTMDLYTVGLHEAVHALGFGSLIDQNGNSKFGATFPYYSRYDRFLKTQSNVPLLTNTGSCNMYNWKFNPSLNTSILEPNYPGPGNCTPDNTNCSFAINYVGGVTQAVYTPDCWSGGSSLSHFEDQCMSPPQGNNLYFVMSNATGTGSTYMKRYLKPEERTVLCDIGYKTTATFGSVSNLNFYNYGAGCSGLEVAGINDGILSSGAYAYVTNVGAPIGFTAVGANGILINDYFPTGSGNTFTCVQSISGTGVISNLTPTSFSYQPTSPGLHLLRYVPVNSSGRRGNITYIYVYAKTGNCVANTCNMINNGNFESGTVCGQFQMAPTPTIDCWDYLYASPDYFVRGCSNSTWAIPTSATYCTPPADTWNGVPGNNHKFMGFWYFSFGGEAAQTPLSSPILPNTAYQLSFWALISPSFGGNNPGVMQFNGDPAVVLAQSSSAQPSLTQGQFLCTANVAVNSNQWQYITTTFTYTGSQSLNSFLVANVSGIGNYIFIDDLKLVPLNNSVSFTPPTSVCQNQAINHLGGYATVPGSFSGTGVTQVGSLYHFNASGTLAPGTYSINFTYTLNNCINNIVQNVTVTPGATLTAAASATSFCSNLGGSVTLSASATPAPPVGYTYTWQPGGSFGPSISVSPTVTTVYTVSVNYPTGCSVSQTLSFVVSNSCCPQSTVGNIPIWTANTIPSGTTLTGPWLINQNVTLGTGGMVSFSFGEFIMAPNVKITVPNGGSLKLDGAHLYACASDMWDGIEVQNGGSIISVSTGSNVTLIEDAKTAIDLSNIPSIIISSPIEVTGIIFNKNYIGVNISNVSVNTLPLLLKSCVFTSRTLTFTPTSWPSSSDIWPGLRSAANPTTGLVAPYDLQGFPISNLLNPYNYQPGHIGIKLSNVANTAGGNPTNGVDISGTNPSSANEFNLFDALGTGIEVTDGSIVTANNVFQNMQYYNTPSGPYGGTGIKHSVTGLMNARLGLAPASPNVGFDYGNRFWECYTAIDATNVFELNIQQCLFRSTQKSSNGIGFLPGNMGISINTNRHQYTINENQFENLTNGIDMQLNYNTYDVGGSGPVNGIYGGNTTVNQNYFGPEVSSSNPIINEFFYKAIRLTGPLSGLTNFAGTMNIFSNQIDRVYNGISIYGMDKYPVYANGNSIILEDDIITGGTQRGIEVLKTLDNIKVQENILVGTGINNTQATLVYFENNYGNPWVTCNDVSNCYEGFVFSDYNLTSIWLGNFMTNLDRGMSLINNGSCGWQGSYSFPCENQWLGVWNPPSFSTYVDGTSDANQSPLFVKTFYPFLPTINGGPGGPNNYTSAFALPSASPTGTWNCPPQTLPPVPTYKISQNPVSIKNTGITGELSLDIFPNPSNGNINLIGTKESETLGITVTDVTGKIIFERKIITAGHLASFSLEAENGVYFVVVKNQDNLKTIKKLVIQK